MPRTIKLSASTKDLKTAILKRLVELDRDRVWLSVQTNIKYRTLNTKLENGNFDFKELWELFHALQMPQEIILELFGRGKDEKTI